MSDLDSRDAAFDEAKARRSESPSGIGPCFIESVQRGAPGWRGAVTVTGSNDEHIDILVSTAEKPGLFINRAVVNGLVEEFAGRLDGEDKVAALHAYMGTEMKRGLELDNVFPQLWSSIFTDALEPDMPIA